MTSDSTPLPSIGELSIHDDDHQDADAASQRSTADSSASTSEDDSRRPSSSYNRLPRPKLGSRKSSGSMIVSRETTTTVVDDDIEEGDVRTMSPRRNSEEVVALGDKARRDLIEQAKVLQMSLQAIVDRVETVKTEHDKLETGNRFLQSYIGELMQTSKITGKSKGKGRSAK